MQPEALRLTYIWIVHSDLDENNLYSEFGSEAQALAYARRHADDLTWVEKVEVAVDEFDEIVEYHDGETIWVYDDESKDSINQQPRPQMEELEDDEEDETVECQDCGTIVNKSDCLKTDGGTYVCKYCQEDFDSLVETLEENEDIVECKECFELFPKSDCIKLDVGYICPTCHQHCEGPDCHEFDLDDIAYVELDDDLVFKIDFPELERFEFGNDMIPDESTPEIENGLLSDSEPTPEIENDPISEPVCVDPECATPIEPPVTKDETITKLVIDEHEAIEGYEQARIEIEENSGLDEEEKKEILDTIEHIKEEEVEHIEELEELGDLAPETKSDEPAEESESEEKEILHEDNWFQKLLRGAAQLFKGNASAEAMADIIFGKDENNKNKPLFIVEFYKERTKTKDDNGNEKETLAPDTSVAGGKGVAKYASFEAAKNAAEKYVKIRKTHEAVIRPIEDPNDLVEKTASGKFKALQYYADGTLNSNVLEDNIIPEYKEKLKKAKEEAEAAEAAKKKAEEEDRKVKDFNTNTIDDERLIDDDEIEAVKNNLPDTYEIEDVSKLAVLVRALSNKEITKENIEALLKDRIKELKKFGLKQKETTAPVETDSVVNKSPDDLEDEQQKTGEEQETKKQQTTKVATNRVKNTSRNKSLRAIVKAITDKEPISTIMKLIKDAGLDINNENVSEFIKEVEAGTITPETLATKNKKVPQALIDLRKKFFGESLEEHINEEHPAIESDQELEGTDNAVVDCEVADIIAHSEDEKPLDCKMEKPALKEPLAGEKVNEELKIIRCWISFEPSEWAEKTYNKIAHAHKLDEAEAYIESQLGSEVDWNAVDWFLRTKKDGGHAEELLTALGLDTKDIQYNPHTGQELKLYDIFDDGDYIGQIEAYSEEDAINRCYNGEFGSSSSDNMFEAELAECLKENTHAKYAKPEGDYKASYNNALKYAKKDNVPYIYGYTQIGNGKFFALEQPIKVTGPVTNAAKDFRSKYKRASVVFIAYPDKDFIESLEEASYRGFAYYEYPVGSKCHVRETPTSFVATNENGTTIGESKTKIGAEGIIDEYLKPSIKEELFTKAEQEEYNMDEDGNSLDSYDTYIRCGFCDEIYTKSECKYERNLGWLCPRCEAAIYSRGEKLTFIDPDEFLEN